MSKVGSLILAIRNKRRVAWLFLAVILASYAIPLVQELDDIEPYPDYYNYIPIYITCDPTQIIDIEEPIEKSSLRDWVNCFGHKVLGNDRILPFAFSVGLVYLAYLLGHYITNDRIIGLIGSATLSINPLLTMYDTSPTYNQAWAFFVILSVVLLYKKSFLAPLVYPLAIFSKILAVSYLPVFVYNVIFGQIKQKKLTFVMTISLISLGVIAIMLQGFGSQVSFNPERFTDGSLQLVIHLIVLLPILGVFVSFMIMFKSKTKINGTKIVYAWMIWILLTTPLLYVFSQDFQFSYRYVPFAAFMSVFIGMSVVNFGNKVVEMLPQKKIKEELNI